MTNTEQLLGIMPLNTISQPQYAWQCELFGLNGQMTLFREEGKQPNAFWRLMQFLVLGNKWRRL